MTGPIDELRTLAASAPGSLPPLEPYLAKVRAAAVTITDEDVESLKQAGITEDEIFEATVAAAIDEGLRRLDRAFEAIR